MEIQTQITINAKAETVWNVLTNFNDYAWNPFIKTVEGRMQKGNTIRVELGGMTKPEVLNFEANKEFRWKGKLVLKGIFDGEHFFILEEKNGATLFTHGEIFSGIVVPLFQKKLLGETKDGFGAMNLALKNKCENESPICS